MLRCSAYSGLIRAGKDLKRESVKISWPVPSSYLYKDHTALVISKRKRPYVFNLI